MVKATSVFVTVDDLEKVFDSELRKEIKLFNETKQNYLNNLNNKTEYYTSFPTPEFSVWITVNKALVEKESEEFLKTRIMDAGWTITTFNWIKDDRTDQDQIMIRVKKQ